MKTETKYIFNHPCDAERCYRTEGKWQMYSTKSDNVICSSDDELLLLIQIIHACQLMLLLTLLGVTNKQNDLE